MNYPTQILTLYAPIRGEGVEQENAHAIESQTFMQGAYNQTKNRDDNIVWSAGAETYNRDIIKQYANRGYT